MSELILRCTFLGRVAAAAILLALAGPPAAAEPAADGALVVRTFPLSPYARELDGQWQGIGVAADGRCYFGSSTHSHARGGMFFRYSPASGAVEPLCDDVTRVCGEDPARTPPQGKLHTDLVEMDGWIYFGTHLANYWGEAAAAYTGGHLVGYEPAGGRFRDFGVIHPNYSIYSAIAGDARRRAIWVWTVPFSPDRGGAGGRLYRVDIDSGRKEPMGAFNPGNGTHHLLIDRRGDCWFTISGGRGALHRVRAEGGKTDRWEAALPDGADFWTWAHPLGDGDRFLVTAGTTLYAFDASQPVGSAGSIRRLRDIGPNGLGIARGGDRVYYVQRAGGKKWTSGGGADGDLRLLSVSLDGAGSLDHGLLVDQAGRRPWRIWSLAADAGGNVYMTGDWKVLPGEAGSLRHARKDGKNAYQELTRAQFFAVARIAHTPAPSAAIPR